MDRAAPHSLQVDDPLHAFLCEEVLCRILGNPVAAPVFEIHPVGQGCSNHWIYRYRERTSHFDVVCKFYGSKPLFDGWIGDRNLRALLMQREFDNLAGARAIGLDRPPHQVIRPLAVNREINCVLVQEHAPGIDLQAGLHAAAHDSRGGDLPHHLSWLASFLADLHGRSRTALPLQGHEAAARLVQLAQGLATRRTISPEQSASLSSLAEHWARTGALGQGRQTWIHGDASPSHFLFDIDRGLTAIDLEGLQTGDPAEDVGRVMAEIQQVFFRYRGEPSASEPYLRHFCASYESSLAPGTEDWEAFLERARFFKGYFQACIGRNFRLDLHYRQRLIEEAAQQLRI